MNTNMMKQEQADEIWDQLNPKFRPADVSVVRVGPNVHFAVLSLPREKSHALPVYVDVGLKTLAVPRPAAIRRRWVLVPADVIAGSERWEMRVADLFDCMRWATTMTQFVTWSGFKSGASDPFEFHCQAFPMVLPDGSKLTALPDAPTQTIVSAGDLPRYRAVEVAVLTDYPARGIRLRGTEGPDAELQVARLAWELGVNYDNLRSFNTAVVPRDGAVPDLFCFPRRRDGRTTYGAQRHQVAALELAGLLQAKSDKQKNEIIGNPEALVKELFADTTPGTEGFHRDFLVLLEA